MNRPKLFEQRQWRLFIILFCSLLFGAMTFLSLTASAPREVQVDVGDNGRPLIHLPAADAFPLRIQRRDSDVLLSSPAHVVFNGQTSLSLKGPESGMVHLRWGAGGQTLSLRLRPGADLLLHGETAALTLEADSDVYLAKAQLDRPLVVQILTAENTLTLGAIRAAGLVVRGGHVRFTGPITIAGDVTVRSTDLTMTPGSRLFTTAGDITLRAGRELQIQESALQAAGNIRLTAGQLLAIRDSAARPVAVRAGGGLYLQGDTLLDISALSHANSSLAAGGDMALRSNAPVRGDALYLSGGQVEIAQLNGRAGDLHSPHDPIVLADGDVSLGSYSGASLHILAGGNILLDSATITGTDSTANTINRSNTTPFNGKDTIAALADLTLSDGTAVTIDGSRQPMLDIRAGVDWTTFAGGAPGDQVLPPGSVRPTFAPASGAAIVVTGMITVTQPEGLVLLTNRYRPNRALSGDIATGDINVSTVVTDQNAGDVIIDSRGDVAVGQLDAFAEVAGTAVTAGDGGAIKVLAADGTITTGGDLNAFARIPGNSSGDAGDGGSILLEAGSGIDLNGGDGDANTYAFSNADGDAGDGGPIRATTGSGDVTARTLDSTSSAFTTAVTGSNGGNILVSTGDGRITVAGDGFFHGVSAYTQSFGAGGNGGNIVMTATQGITVGQSVLAYSNGVNANGGDIHLHTSDGDISVGDVTAYAAANDDVGSGGNVTLEALDGAITSGDIEAFADALSIHHDVQDGGDITVRALHGDAQTGVLASYTEARGLEGDTGNAGSITVTASESITTAGAVQAYALAASNNGNSGRAGDGGDVTLQATETISIAGGVDAYSEAADDNGIAANGGAISITAINQNIHIVDDVNSYAAALGFPSGDAGSGGPLSLQAGTGIDARGGRLNAYARSNEGTVGSGGAITATTGSGNIVLEAADASAYNPFADNSLGTGDGGDILLSTEAGVIEVNPDELFVFDALNSQSVGADVTGNGGNIVVTATQGIHLMGHVRSLASGATGNGGSVKLTTVQGDILVEDVRATAVDNNDAPGSGGDILLQALDGAVTAGDVGTFSLALLIHNDSQDGGEITIEALDGDVTTGQIASFTEARGLEGDTGTGGAIGVTAGGSITTTGPVQAYAWAAENNLNSGVAGDAGPIDLRANGSISITGSIESYSAAPGDNGTAAKAGDATLSAGGDIAFTYLDGRSRSATGTIGAGGTLVVSSTGFVRATGTPFNSPASIAATGLADSSAITISHGGAGLTPFTVGDAGANGALGALTTGDALITPTESFLYSHFETPNLWLLSVSHPLSLTKQAAPAVNAPERGEITYTMVLSNPATIAALDVMLTDTLPVEVEFNRWIKQPAGANLTSDLLTWHGDVPEDNAVTFEFVMDHVGDAGDVFTNTAVFEHPSSLGRGAASAMVSIEAPNLGITKTVNVTTAVPGAPIQYTLDFVNAGPGLAREVIITDVAPVALINLNIVSSGAVITPTDGSTLAWAVEDLAAGAGGVITITGNLTRPLTRDLTITNTALVTTPFDVAPDDNQDSVAVTVLNGAPQAVADTAITYEGETVTIPVLANDSDPNADSLSLVTVGTPDNGSAVLNAAAIDYTPALGFTGTDVFTYTVSDGLMSATTAVTVTVLPTDSPVFLPFVTRD